MSDFDFDELDKAVSNVLSDKDSTPETVPQETAKSELRSENNAQLQPEPPAEPVLVSAPAEPVAAPVEPPAPIVKPRSSINRKPPVFSAKRSGVIDIMAPPSKRPSHESMTLRPAGSAENNAPSEEEPSVSVPKRVPTEDAALRWPPKGDEPAQPTNSSEPAPKHEGTAGANIEPDGSFERFDSLSRSGFDNDKAAKEDQPKETTEQPSEVLGENDNMSLETPAPTPEEPKTISENESEKEPASPQSPFLSDAKVEKRPLGAFSASQPESEAAEPSEPETPLAVAETKPEPTETPLPEEEKKLDVGNEHLLEDGHEHETAPKAETNPAPATALDSIPQQYKIAAEQHDESAHKVFDTSEYHAPLQGHDTKAQRGGNGLLIASIILLVLAVAAAAGIYFYGDKLGL